MFAATLGTKLFPVRLFAAGGGVRKQDHIIHVVAPLANSGPRDVPWQLKTPPQLKQVASSRSLRGW